MMKPEVVGWLWGAEVGEIIGGGVKVETGVSVAISGGAGLGLAMSTVGVVAILVAC